MHEGEQLLEKATMHSIQAFLQSLKSDLSCSKKQKPVNQRFPHVLEMSCLVEVVAKCWEHAEQTLRDVIELKYHDLDEETITTLFHREFQFTLSQASENSIFESAFIADLEAEGEGYRGIPKIKELADGLVADFVLHNKREEGVTGGDFGLVISRPRVTHGMNNRFSFDVFQSGLLVQAKGRKRDEYGKGEV